MPFPVTRIPPPQLLDLTLPSVPLLEVPRRPLRTNNVQHASDPVRSVTLKVTPKHTTNTPPVVTNNSDACQRLVNLLHQIHVEMEDDIARIRLAIGQTQDDIKLLRAERAQKVDEMRTQASNDSANSAPKDEVQGDLSMC